MLTGIRLSIRNKFPKEYLRLRHQSEKKHSPVPPKYVSRRSERPRRDVLNRSPVSSIIFARWSSSRHHSSQPCGSKSQWPVSNSNVWEENILEIPVELSILLSKLTIQPRAHTSIFASNFAPKITSGARRAYGLISCGGCEVSTVSADEEGNES